MSDDAGRASVVTLCGTGASAMVALGTTDSLKHTLHTKLSALLDSLHKYTSGDAGDDITKAITELFLTSPLVGAANMPSLQSVVDLLGSWEPLQELLDALVAPVGDSSTPNPLRSAACRALGSVHRLVTTRLGDAGASSATPAQLGPVCKLGATGSAVHNAVVAVLHDLHAQLKPASDGDKAAAVAPLPAGGERLLKNAFRLIVLLNEAPLGPCTAVFAALSQSQLLFPDLFFHRVFALKSAILTPWAVMVVSGGGGGGGDGVSTRGLLVLTHLVGSRCSWSS